MRLAAAAALALAGTALSTFAAPRAARAESAPPPAVRQVDLLIVVDSSPGAAAERSALAAGLPAFVQAVKDQFRGDYASPAIDLHVGVITGDAADHGALRTAAVATCAAAPTGAFVAYAADQWGQTRRNYSGELADAIACLLPPGVVTAAGAPPLAAPQPLANLGRALDGSIAGNAGFVRPDATLAVLVITDQDDCSPTGAPLDRVACAAAGWSCTPAIDATAGPRSNCTAVRAPVGLVGLDDAVASLTALKASPSLVAFGVARGAPAPVAISAGPAIAPSCVKGALIATPALRLDAVAGAFTNSWLEVGCDDAGIASFVFPILAATYVPVLADDYHGDCDGGFGYPADDGGVGRGHGDHDAMGCGCTTGGAGVSGGTGLVLLLGFAVALRRRGARS